MTGTVTIPAGVASLKVEGLGLACTPSRVLCTVAAPAGGRSLFASIVAGTLTADGFTVDLSGPTSTTPGYKLHWFASLSFLASDTFETYAAGLSVPVTMNDGKAWGAAWSWTVGDLGLVSEDTFETYSVSSDVTGETLNGEGAWGTPWSWGSGDLGLRCSDNMDGYSPVVDVPGGSVSINMAGATPGQFKYENLASSIVLEANAFYYLVSYEVSGGDNWYDSNSIFQITGVGQIQPVYSASATSWIEITATLYYCKGYVPTSLKYGSGIEFAVSVTLGTARNNFTGNVGIRIEVGPDPITVTALARWCISGNSATHTVKIVKSFLPVNSLSGGTGWAGPYVDRVNDLGIRSNDRMETYSDAASVSGLNGGTGWAGAYVDR